MSDEKALGRIEALLQQLAAHLGMGTGRGASTAASSSGGEDVADDSDLDSQYGNPDLRIPKSEKWQRWASYSGRSMSDAPPALLAEYARLLEWQASKDEQEGKVTSSGKPTAPYKRRDAARARGWARRNAAAHTTGAQPLAANQMSDAADADIPF